MTAQPRKHRDREPEPADSPRPTSGPPPPEYDIAAGTASRAGRDPHGEWLAYSVDEAVRVTGLSCGLLDDQTRPSNLACVKVGTWRLISCQHLQQFPGIAS
jgi:hypothetical protein